MKLSDFFSFEKMIATSIVKLVYWLGIAGIVVFGLMRIWAAFSFMGYSFGGGFGMLLVTLFGIAISVVVWRVLCEIYIVVFQINDRLGEIREHLTKDKA